MAGRAVCAVSEEAERTGGEVQRWWAGKKLQIIEIAYIEQMSIYTEDNESQVSHYLRRYL